MTGPTGATGPTAENFTETSGFAANTTGATIAVVLGGTPVPLPSEQDLGPITVNGTDTIFTVPDAGRYFISYNLNFTAGLLVSSQVEINGVVDPALTRAPALALSSLEANAIVTLTAGSTIELQLFGLLGAAVLQGGVGASLTIIRLSD
ncbi:hypothetical protein BTS2_3998 [Bacillus sp. TS-2]|nr:hypothetical protein BTS2_3998 [Bacillus sp. TS-2]